VGKESVSIESSSKTNSRVGYFWIRMKKLLILLKDTMTLRKELKQDLLRSSVRIEIESLVVLLVNDDHDDDDDDDDDNNDNTTNNSKKGGGWWWYERAMMIMCKT
jgi:hypothetical protein